MDYDTRTQKTTVTEMTEQLELLFSCLRLKTGSPEAAAKGYAMALDGCSRHALTEVVRLLIQGKIDGVSKEFAPMPPKLAELVRAEMKRIEEKILRERALPPPTAGANVRADEAVRWQRAIDLLEGADPDKFFLWYRDLKFHGGAPALVQCPRNFMPSHMEGHGHLRELEEAYGGKIRLVHKMPDLFAIG